MLQKQQHRWQIHVSTNIYNTLSKIIAANNEAITLQVSYKSYFSKLFKLSAANYGQLHKRVHIKDDETASDVRYHVVVAVDRMSSRARRAPAYCVVSCATVARSYRTSDNSTRLVASVVFALWLSHFRAVGIVH